MLPRSTPKIIYLEKKIEFTYIDALKILDSQKKVALDK